MTSDPSGYTPISCEFHDLLEELASAGKLTRIRYRGDEGFQQHCDASIADVYSKAGAEYVLLSSGERVRLDRLEEVDGEKLSDYRD